MKSSDIRKQNVLKMLRTSKKLSVEDAMRTLGVSESTVRRLFAQLEAEGEGIRAYGGICCTGRSSGIESYLLTACSLKIPPRRPQ